jgi:lysophospholipase L1-like esterase
VGLRGAGANTITRPLLWAAVQLGIVAVVLGGAELYLRLHETYVIEHEGSALGGTVLSAEKLLDYTLKGARLIPNAHVVIRNHRISHLPEIAMNINSSGFRGAEVPRQKEPGEFRILVLGDSITWADYLPEKQTYVRRMERYLRRLAPDRKIRAINGGVGDIGLTEEVAILEERGLAIHPDLVVVEFYLNDSRPPWGFAAELSGRGFLRRHSLLADKAYTYIKLQGWLRESGERANAWRHGAESLDWAHDPDAFRRLATEARFDWGAAWEPDSWAVIKDRLGRLKALAAEHHFQVAIVAFPVRYQVYAQFLDDEPQRQMGALTSAAGFRYFDLLPTLREHQDVDQFFDQCHPRAGANDLIGRSIAEFLHGEFLS